jgi:hypothetical protein
MAHGPNDASESFQCCPQSPNFHIFGLIFDGNTKKLEKNLTNLAHKCFSNIFLARHEI